jgi:glycosyltransferase involved in cell wall biosynthesis
MEKIRCPRDFTAMQKNNAFCSICTVNYTAYAGVLSESLRKAGHEEPHYVLVVDYDEKYKNIIEKFGFKPVFLSELGVPKIDELVEKYSAFELSNVLKPFFMEWLLKNHAEIDKLIFLDTDIYVYSPLNAVLDYIEKNEKISVLITPHLNDYESYNERSDYKIEMLYMAHGLYNGGFYVIKNDKNSLRFLDWHKKKLYSFGYGLSNAYMYVDQKILDFAPILFEFVGLYKNKAYDIAHWNYFPGIIREDNSEYFVEDNKLVFFHFSQIPKKNITENFAFDVSDQDRAIFQKLVLAYEERLRENGHEEIKKIPYAFKDRYKEPSLSLVNPLKAKSIELDAVRLQLKSAKTEMELTKSQLGSTEKDLASAKNVLESTQHELDLTKTKMVRIYSSREWKLVMKLQKIAKYFLPKNSARRKIISASWVFAKAPWRLARKSKSVILLCVDRLKKYLKPRKGRRINADSKKIVFIGHSYHAKTRSSDFLLDYLKKNYDTKVILDESWLGEKPFPDLSFIDDSYLAVIFWQNLPSLEAILGIKNDNLIFFPMYDAVGSMDFSWWRRYENLKIVCFSKTLHEKLKKWRLTSMYIQYFPAVREFIPGKEDEVFFWQRLTNININTVARLFRKDNLKIHIHRGIDPNHKFVQPSKEDEKKFHISYSDWFESRDEMLENIGGLIKQKGIYIAPRELEGIGHSFLEAMAMGKAVIAVDNPTMNEYIEHGKTGYLFDLSKPKKIDLSNIENVQNNAYEFMKAGRKKWEKDKIKIIDFIKKS